MTQAQAEAVYESHTKGMTETQEARMRQLAEKIDFDDAQEFAEKLHMLKDYLRLHYCLFVYYTKVCILFICLLY